MEKLRGTSSDAIGSEGQQYREVIQAEVNHSTCDLYGMQLLFINDLGEYFQSHRRLERGLPNSVGQSGGRW